MNNLTALTNLTTSTRDQNETETENMKIDNNNNHNHNHNHNERDTDSVENMKKLKILYKNEFEYNDYENFDDVEVWKRRDSVRYNHTLLELIHPKTSGVEICLEHWRENFLMVCMNE